MDTFFFFGSFTYLLFVIFAELFFLAFYFFRIISTDRSFIFALCCRVLARIAYIHRLDIHKFIHWQDKKKMK